MACAPEQAPRETPGSPPSTRPVPDIMGWTSEWRTSAPAAPRRAGSPKWWEAPQPYGAAAALGPGRPDLAPAAAHATPGREARRDALAAPWTTRATPTTTN